MHMWTAKVFGIGKEGMEGLIAENDTYAIQYKHSWFRLSQLIEYNN